MILQRPLRLNTKVNRIVVRHIERVPLKENALKKLIKRYARTKNKILVVFDKRFKNVYGQYFWDSRKKVHNIQIAVKKFDSVETTIKELIGTIMHEIRHLNQKVHWGRKFYIARYDSECEADAMNYEQRYSDNAIRFYKKNC
jgi:tRNA A37 threonylcarbamoyladenosine modification protein TsaB